MSLFVYISTAGVQVGGVTAVMMLLYLQTQVSQGRALSHTSLAHTELTPSYLTQPPISVSLR